MKEVRMKEWVIDEAHRLGVSVSAIYMRVNRGKYPKLLRRRVSSREVWVKA